MPTIETRYLCEVCGATYKDAEGALKCEALHIHVKRLVDETFSPRSEYPASIRVELSDGTWIAFDRRRDGAY